MLFEDKEVIALNVIPLFPLEKGIFFGEYFFLLAFQKPPFFGGPPLSS